MLQQRWGGGGGGGGDGMIMSPQKVVNNTCIKPRFINNLFTKQQNVTLDLVQIESFYRQQKNSNPMVKICFGKGRKYSGKKRKCWLPAFSPFCTMFSKAFFLRVIKTQVCVVKT